MTCRNLSIVLTGIFSVIARLSIAQTEDAATTATVVESPPSYPNALPYRCWQFQAHDWFALADAIPKAAAAGINRIQLSHEIIMNAEQLWEGEGHEQRLEFVNNAIELAHEHGLKVDAWTHELSGVPERLLTEDDRCKLGPELWKWLDEKYERLFKKAPGLDGLVLSLSGADYPIYRLDKIITSRSPHITIAHLVEAMNKVCRRHGKLLTVRTFTPEEVQRGLIQAGLRAHARRPTSEANPESLIFMTQCVPRGSPIFPYHKLLGEFKGRPPQIVEIDLGQRNTGENKLPYCAVEYVYHVLKYARERGVVGAVARVDDLHRHALGTPSEVNIDAFSRLLLDDSKTPDELLFAWTANRYGPEAGPPIARALRRTYDVTNIALFPLQHSLMVDGRVPSWEEALLQLTQSEQTWVRHWIKSPELDRAHDDLTRPDDDTFRRLDSEADLARGFIKQSVKDLNEARPHLEPADFDELRSAFERAGDTLEMTHTLATVFYESLRLKNLEESGASTPTALDAARRGIAEDLTKLSNWADRIERVHGPDYEPGNPARIRRFVRDIEILLQP